MAGKAAKDVIKVAADVSGKIMVHARGAPAQVIAAGAAAAITFIGVGAAYGAYKGATGIAALIKRRRVPDEET